MPARTPSQTIGPFFHLGLRWPGSHRVAFAEKGEPVVLTGRITDGAGEAVGDALFETWQRCATGEAPACASGSANPNGFGRVETAKDGTFRSETTMPGAPAPSIDVTIFARGLLRPLRTRVYFSEEAARADPALASLARSPRLATLVAKRAAAGEYRWDVRLQGEGETAFFAF
jgi:protocatechuate 3,4-dioxygenase, alpha subunit